MRPGESGFSLVLLPQKVHLRLEVGRPGAGTDAPVTRMVSIVAGDETGIIRVVLFDKDESTVFSGPDGALTTLPIVLRNCYAHIFEGHIELRVIEGVGSLSILEKETAGVPAPPTTINSALDVSKNIWEATRLTLP